MRDTGLFFAYLSSSKQEEINLSQRLAFRIAIWWFVVDSNKPGEILRGHKKALLTAVVPSASTSFYVLFFTYE